MQPAPLATPDLDQFLRAHGGAIVGLVILLLLLRYLASTFPTLTKVGIVFVAVGAFVVTCTAIASADRSTRAGLILAWLVIGLALYARARYLSFGESRAERQRRETLARSHERKRAPPPAPSPLPGPRSSSTTR